MTVPPKADVVATDDGLSYWRYNDFDVDGLRYLYDYDAQGRNVIRPMVSAIKDFAVGLTGEHFDDEGFLKKWLPTSGHYRYIDSYQYCDYCWLKNKLINHYAPTCKGEM